MSTVLSVSSPSIVLAVHSAQMYGAATSLLAHARLLQELGIACSVLLPEHGPLENHLQSAGISSFVIPIQHFGLRRRRPGWQAPAQLLQATGSRLAFVAQTARFLRRQHKPVLHAHSIFCGYAALAARMAGAPVVWHVREDRPPGLRGLFRNLKLIALARQVLFVSNGIRRNYYCRDSKCRVVYNFIEIPDPVPPATAWPHKIFTLLFVGMLRPSKGIFEFVRICRRLRDEALPFKAVMAGQGQAGDERNLRSAIRSAGLDDAIELLGFQADMRAVYARADALLLPTHTDSLPRSIMEAMAHGLPVVATAVGGIPEMVRDGDTGFLFALSDLPAAATGLVRLARDANLRVAMGNRARERARELFSKSSYADQIRGVYREFGWSPENP